MSGNITLCPFARRTRIRQSDTLFICFKEMNAVRSPPGILLAQVLLPEFKADIGIL